MPTVSTVWSIDLLAMIADPRRTSHWHVGKAATTRITEWADRWGRLPGARLLLRRNRYRVEADLTGAAPLLAQALLATGMGGLQFIVDEAQFGTRSAFAPDGEGVF